MVELLQGLYLNEFNSATNGFIRLVELLQGLYLNFEKNGGSTGEITCGTVTRVVFK